MLTWRFLFVLLCVGLGGCVVYRPMQNTVPTIRAKGEGEAMASTYLTGRFEGSASYSPVSHLLLHVAGSFKPYSPLTDTSKSRERQYDVGIGTYWKLNYLTTVGAMLGYGQGSSWAQFQDGGLFSSVVPYSYVMHFDKAFGEAYGLFQPIRRFSLGASYRLTQVNFTSLTNFGRPVDLSDMLRQEFMFQARIGVGGAVSAPPPVQLQAGWGVSFPPITNQQLYTYSPEQQYLLKPQFYVTLGIRLLPQLLFQPAQQRGGRSQ